MRPASPTNLFADVFETAFGSFACRGPMKSWKMRQRAERRAQRLAWRRSWRSWSPLRNLFHLVWAVIWITFFVWLATGGHEARQTVIGFLQFAGDTLRDAFVNLFGLMQ